MGKKKKKSTHAQLTDSSSCLSTSDRDSSCVSFSSANVSIISEGNLPEKFLVANIQMAKCTAYAKCIKTDFENIIFINSSAMLAHGIEDLVFVEGESNKQLCVAHSNENVKKHLVVFPKSKCGFRDGELVVLQPYLERIRTAEQITLSSSENKDNSPNIQEFILRYLSSKFIHANMTIKFNLLDRRYVYVIENITSSIDQTDLSSEESPNGNLVFYENSPSTVLKFESDILQTEEIFFKTIGGLETPIKKLKKYFQLFLNLEPTLDSVFCGSLILQGPSGTGKSLLLQSISKCYKLHVEYIMWYELFALPHPEIKKKLETVFRTSISQASSLIIIEDFNYLSPNKDEAENVELYAIKMLSHLIETLNDSRVMILVATTDAKLDESIFKTNRRLVDVIEIKNPSASERFDILNKLLSTKNHKLTCNQVQECAESAHGFTGKDFSDALIDAEILCIKRAHPNLTVSNQLFHIVRTNASSFAPILYSDLKMVLQLKKPTIIATADLQAKKVQWSDIGGMTDIKEKLKQLVEWPFKYPEAFKHFNVAPSRGVLMYGPPGCSKTMIAKAIATECSLNFISKNASDLFDKYVGESEKAVRDLFAAAKSKAPCIIFLDEIDALVVERGSSSTSSGVADRIVTTFLTELDGVEELHGVIIIAATNRPDLLDDALVRNGRINYFIYVPLPDANTREEILKIEMSKRTLSASLDYKLLSLKTEGYSCAEIINICNEAALQLLAENPSAERPVFTMEHFEQALKQVLPRTSPKVIDFYKSFNEKHCIKS